MSNLKILVTTLSYHPQFDIPPERKVKEFDIHQGIEAEKHYNRKLALSKNSGGLMVVSITIVEKE